MTTINTISKIVILCVICAATMMSGCIETVIEVGEFAGDVADNVDAEIAETKRNMVSKTPDSDWVDGETREFSFVIDEADGYENTDLKVSGSLTPYGKYYMVDVYSYGVLNDVRYETKLDGMSNDVTRLISVFGVTRQYEHEDMSNDRLFKSMIDHCKNSPSQHNNIVTTEDESGISIIYPITTNFTLTHSTGNVFYLIITIYNEHEGGFHAIIESEVVNGCNSLLIVTEKYQDYNRYVINNDQIYITLHENGDATFRGLENLDYVTPQPVSGYWTN